MSELTKEELLEIAKQKGSAVSNFMDDDSNISSFVREYGIKDGSTPIPNYQIYHEYFAVWQPTGRNKLSKIEFFRKFNKLFETKRSNSTRYYLLNKGVFSENKEVIDETKRQDKKRSERKKRKPKK